MVLSCPLLSIAIQGYGKTLHCCKDLCPLAHQRWWYSPELGSFLVQKLPRLVNPPTHRYANRMIQSTALQAYRLECRPCCCADELSHSSEGTMVRELQWRSLYPCWVSLLKALPPLLLHKSCYSIVSFSWFDRFWTTQAHYTHSHITPDFSYQTQSVC
jgi:hypothetical protein